ncbi:MAG: YdhR family protein [Acetobacteraceae bacterium]|nr:YdhR family protein [Acetobacteraceae bacterium]
MAADGPVVLEMNFRAAPPWGAARVEKLRALADAIAAETPGLLWKIWTEDAAAGRAGGIYAFATRAEAEAYREMHTQRVVARGATDIRAQLWDVNTALSSITRAKL